MAGCGSNDNGGEKPDATATRTVVDLVGRAVEIPAEPQRIVVLDSNRVIVDVVALGFVPVGATTNPTNPDGGLAPTLGATADEITELGPVTSVDIERVAGLRPDLIRPHRRPCPRDRRR